MPQYKLKEGKLVRWNAKGEKETLVAGDKVEFTKDQARTFGLNLLELQHEDEQDEGEQGGDENKDPQLTVNPGDQKQAAKKPAQKPAEKKA